jgi:hypothetical protein
MEKLTKQFLLDRGFKLVGGEYGGAYIMRNPDKSVCDAIEVLLDDDCFHIHHYFADDSELGRPWETFNKINDITLTVDMFIKTLEVLGLDDEWIEKIRNHE